MNINRDPEALMGAWLDDGPAQLPVETRQAIVVGLRTQPRRRRGITWPFGDGLVRPRLDLRLAALGVSAIALLLVAGAIVLSILSQNNHLPAAPLPSTSAPTGIATPPPEQPTDLGIFEPVAGRIVYGDDSGIWGVDPSSAGADTTVQLSSEAAMPLGWSRDGTKLLISKPYAFAGQLYVMSAGGSTTQLTDESMAVRGATISPDGSQVVFAGGTGTNIDGLYSVDADGGPVVRLLKAGDGLIQAPTFSPDGTQIAYTFGGGDHDNAVWVMKSDGSEAHEIVPNTGVVGHVHGLQWSPAGDRIALGLGGFIYTYASDGSDSRLVSGGIGTCESPEECAVNLPKMADAPYWSPDGTQISFTTGCVNGIGNVDESGCVLAISDSDGTDTRSFTYGKSGPWHPGDLLPWVEQATPTPEPASPTPETATSTPALPVPTPAPQVFEPRKGGEFITFASRGSGQGWNLAAGDPETGDLRTIVDTSGLVDCTGPDAACTNYIRRAEWSTDGRWVAFQISNQSLDDTKIGPCSPNLGLWVQGPDGSPRQLTTPCDAAPAGSNEPVQELWAWSPVDNQLAYSRIDGGGDELSVIDPRDGSARSLSTGNIDAPYPVESSSVVWSPDGSTIAYVDANSVYAVDVSTGERSLLADSFGSVIDMAWSPNGTQILILDQGRYRLQVMNADGSDLHALIEGQDACCGMRWAPDGSRILYQLSLNQPGESFKWHSQSWTVSPEGVDPAQIFDSIQCGSEAAMNDTLPAWTPDGSQIAYNACGSWKTASADGTGDAQPISQLLWRSWMSSGLTGEDLAGIGQINH